MKKTLYPVCPVLLVDDEEQFLSTAAFILKGGGITNIAACSDSRKVMPLLETQEYSAVVLDLTMPYVGGRELLTRINGDFPGIPVIVLTAINEVDSAVQCMKEGALDYLVKPVQRDTFVAAIARALKFREIQEENNRLKKMGGGLYFVNMKAAVYEFAVKSGFIRHIGPDHFFDHKSKAIFAIYRNLDRSKCSNCQQKVFMECRQ